MAFKAIHDQNPFVVPAILLALILLLRSYFASRPGPYRPYAQKLGRKSVLTLSILLGICIVLIPTFEMYFRVMECRVSDQYMKENLELAHRAISVFEQNKIPYWLDYATLLNQLREQSLNAWEQDVDFSLIAPSHLQSLRNLPIAVGGGTLAALLDAAKKDPMGPYPALNVETLVKKLEAGGFDVVYDEARMLIQCWGKQRRGPHIDVWLWAAVPTDFSTPPPVPSATLWTKDSPPVFWSGEEHLGYNHRSFQHLFPLKKASWLSRDVSVPADPHAVSQGEFGHYGGSYMTAQVFRGDCFHNFFQLRYLYS